MIETNNPYAPPQSSIELVVNDECWRSGKVLVMHMGGGLPKRCLKCNADAIEPNIRKTLHWHHPGWYALILLNILIYAIVAAFVRKKVEVVLPLCEGHKHRRKMFILAAWASIGIGLSSFLVFIQLNWEIDGAAVIFGFCLILGIGLSFATRIVYPSSITNDEIRLKGCGKEFLESVPER